MDIFELDKLILFILFVIPGFVCIKTYGLIAPSEKVKSSETIVDAIAYSCINYSIALPFIFIAESTLKKDYELFYYVIYVCIILLLPIAIAFSWYKIRNTEPIKKRAHHPIGKPWDYVFSKREWYWTIVTLKDGSKVAGKYGSKSFSSSNPESEQIYLEEAWLLNSDGGFERPTSQTKGIIIVSDIQTVELFEYNSKEPS